MAYLGRKRARVMDKFHGERFSLWKFKMKMVLAFMDLWDIVNESKKDPLPQVLKVYPMCVKKAMSIINLNLPDNMSPNSCAHIGLARRVH